jgi:hypothetical protein
MFRASSLSSSSTQPLVMTAEYSTGLLVSHASEKTEVQNAGVNNHVLLIRVNSIKLSLYF